MTPRNAWIRSGRLHLPLDRQLNALGCCGALKTITLELLRRGDLVEVQLDSLVPFPEKPQSRRKQGVIGYLDPIPGFRLESIWTLWSVNLRPLPDGGTCLHSYVVDAELAADSNTVPQNLAEKLRGFAAPLLPAEADEAALDTRIGVRPVPEDGLPIVGSTAAAPNLYTVATHSGVHLAPILGELAAAEIAEGKRTLELAPYRPDRALDGVSGEPVDDSLREMIRT